MTFQRALKIFRCVVCFRLFSLLNAVRVTKRSERANITSDEVSTGVGSYDGMMTFYVYRAESTTSYPLENVNVASLGGVMWYLHHEIIFTCDGAGGLDGTRAGGSGILGERKFNITRILRYKLHVKPTRALLNRGLHFSGLTAFDGGKATGPFLHGAMGDWRQFGYTVGCGRIGEFPHKNWPSGKKYPDAIWYSLIGPCATQHWAQRTEECTKNVPGGLCSPGVMPTGAHDCTYQYEDAGEIDINELVGITPRWSSRAEFCKECRVEGDSWKRGGCGLNFWGWNIDDVRSNYAQVDAARRMFEKKYPHSAKDENLMSAPCDFNKWKYGYRWWR